MSYRSFVVGVSVLAVASSAGCQRTTENRANGTLALGAEACSGPPITLADVGEDLRQLWKRQEVAATGKRMGRQAEIPLTLSSPVDAGLLRGALTLVGQVNAQGYDCTGDFGAGPLKAEEMPLAAGTSVAAAWRTKSSKLGNQEYPRDFDVFALGDLTGIPSSEGPLAAGGTVKLQSMSVNTSTKSAAVGLVAGKDLSLTSGTVVGKAFYGGNSTIQWATPAGGTEKGSPIDFAGMKTTLVALTDMLGQMAPNGTVSANGSTITLAGSDPIQNVFLVDGGALKKASSITVTVPAKAVAIVNVTGASITVGSCGITLGNGVDAAHILWNTPWATSLSISSVGFQGTVLAPRAAASVANASFKGTLVAASLAASSASFQHAPFVGMDAIPRYVFKPVDPLKRDCTYTLTLARTPLDAAGHCLADTVEITFRAAGSDAPSFQHETTGVAYSAGKSAPGTFDLRDGVNTPVADTFRRYAPALGIDPLEELRLEGALRPSIVRPGMSSGYYPQYHGGVKVFGYGFRVEQSSEGYARSVLGKVAPASVLASIPTVPSVGQEKAISAALAGVAQPYPWVSRPGVYQPPAAELRIQEGRAGGALQLVWSVDTSLSGTRDRATLVDALTGSVLFHDDGGRPKVPPRCPVDASWTLESSTAAEITVDTPAYCRRSTPTAGETNAFATSASKSGSQTEYLLSTAKLAGPSPKTYPLAAIADLSESAGACRTSTTFDGDYGTVGTAFLLGERLGQYWDTLDLPMPGPTKGATWHWIDGNGLDPLWMVVSSDAKLFDRENERYGVARSWNAPAPAGWVGNTHESSIAFDPTQTTNASPPDQPDVLGHEFAHVVHYHLLQRVGRSTWQYVPQTGALTEGYADFMGALFARWLLGRDTWSHEVGPARDIAHPSIPDSLTGSPHPDTTQSPYYSTTCAPIYCEAHQNSTIFSHWMYLLGYDGQITNSASCQFALTPLGGKQWTEDQRWKYVAQLVFTAIAQLGDSPKFDDMRTATLQVVGANTPEGYLLAHAWEAVGVVGSVDGVVSPANKAEDVSPSGVVFQFEEPADMGIYQIKVEKVVNGIPGTPVQTSCRVDATKSATRVGHVVYACDPLNLEPSSEYDWKLVAPWTASADTCYPTLHFKTGNPSIEVFGSLGAERDAVSGAITDYLVDWQGDIGFNYPGAPLAGSPVNSKVAVALGKDATVACDPVGASFVTDPRGAPQGFNAQLRGLFGPPGPIPGTVYYIAAQALALDGKSLTVCTKIPFKFHPLERPVPLSPGELTVVKPETFKMLQTIPFTWDHALAGATYQLTIKKTFPLPDTYAGDLVIDVAPTIDSTGKATWQKAGGFGMAGMFTWSVTAKMGSQKVSSTDPWPAGSSQPGDTGMTRTFFVLAKAPQPAYPLAIDTPADGWWTYTQWYPAPSTDATRVKAWKVGGAPVVHESTDKWIRLTEFTDMTPWPAGYCWSVSGLSHYHAPGSPPALLVEVEGEASSDICFHTVATEIAITKPPNGATLTSNDATLMVGWNEKHAAGQYAVSLARCDPDGSNCGVAAQGVTGHIPGTLPYVDVPQTVRANHLGTDGHYTLQVCPAGQDGTAHTPGCKSVGFNVNKAANGLVVDPVADVTGASATVNVTWRADPGKPQYLVGYTYGCQRSNEAQGVTVKVNADMTEEVDPTTGQVRQVAQHKQVMVPGSLSCDLKVVMEVCTMNEAGNAAGCVFSNEFTIRRPPVTPVTLQITGPKHGDKLPGTGPVTFTWVSTPASATGYLTGFSTCDIGANGLAANCTNNGAKTWQAHAGGAAQAQSRTLQLQPGYIYDVWVCQASYSSTTSIDSTCQITEFQVGVAGKPAAGLPALPHCIESRTQYLDFDFKTVSGATYYVVEYKPILQGGSVGVASRTPVSSWTTLDGLTMSAEGCALHHYGPGQVGTWHHLAFQAWTSEVNLTANGITGFQYRVSSDGGATFPSSYGTLVVASGNSCPSGSYQDSVCANMGNGVANFPQ